MCWYHFVFGFWFQNALIIIIIIIIAHLFMQCFYNYLTGKPNAARVYNFAWIFYQKCLNKQ